MECNIDARGQYVRMMLGIFAIIGALPFVLVTVYGVLDPLIGWTVVAGLVAAGAFGIFEGWSGWCIIRAMGIRTSL
ncbi:MAG: hypothetical protein QF911_02760 [Candidatus Thalassarchaeaceae archaeon]|jgi:hypothetical protein|nr:hypothetical protein [Candidatus Thalassarchaeaceae archaeon]